MDRTTKVARPDERTHDDAAAGDRILGWRPRWALRVHGAVVPAVHGWRLPALYGTLLAAGTLIVLFRIDPSSWNVLWGEDGAIFLSSAYRYGFVDNLFTPWAGYMHLVPRAVAQVAAILPPASVAIVITVVASFIWSATALVAADFARAYIASPVLRMLLWLSILLFPQGSQEVVGNVANSHWFLLFALFWALMARDRGILQAVIASAVAAAAALSDPLALIAAPIAVARLLLLRGWRAHAVTIAYGASLLLQLVIVAFADRESGNERAGPFDLLQNYLLRVVWGGVLGHQRGGAYLVAVGIETATWISAAVLLLVVAGAVWAVRMSLLPIIAIGYSIGFNAVTTWLMWYQFQPLPADRLLQDLNRYPVVPVLVLYSAVFVIAGIALNRVAIRRGVVLSAVVATTLVLMLTWTTAFRSTARTDYPDIREQVTPGMCRDVDDVATVAVLPGPPWSVSIPCRLLP